MALSLSPHRNQNMAMERYVPISRSPYSFFDPSWEVGTWHDFGSTYHRMEEQMRSMDRQIEDMFRRFGRLTPMDYHQQRVPRLSMQPMLSQSMMHPQPIMQPQHMSGFDNWPAIPAPARMSALAMPADWNMENPIITDKDGARKLKLQFDVRQFKPEEITVRTQDNTLSVHARHEEKSDAGQVYREYRRQYLLPPSVNLETLASMLSPEGVLSISAPMPNALPDAPRERVIPIEHTPSKP